MSNEGASAAAEQNKEAPMPDGEHCIVCTEQLSFVSLGPCNHPVTCSLCTLKLRMLVKDQNCVLCKQAQARVFIINAKTKNQRKYEDFQTWGDVSGQGLIYDEPSESFFELENDGEKHYNELKALRDYRCGVSDCPRTANPFANKEQLQKHLKQNHDLHLCDLCWEFKQLFPLEQIRYGHKALSLHINKGDRKAGESGHPMCQFCKKRYYNDDYLYKHLNKDHENCHVCRRDGKLDDYYRDRRALFRHFRRSHFVCEEPQCLEEFKVYGSDIELQGHILREHPEKAVNRSIKPGFTVRRAGYDGFGVDINEQEYSSATDGAGSLDRFAFAYRPGQDRTTPPEELFSSVSTGEGQQVGSTESSLETARWAAAAGAINMQERLHDESQFPQLSSQINSFGAPSWGSRPHRLGSNTSFANAVGGGYGNLRGFTATQRQNQRQRCGKTPIVTINRDESERQRISQETLTSRSQQMQNGTNMVAKDPVPANIQVALGGNRDKMREFQELCGYFNRGLLSVEDYYNQVGLLLKGGLDMLFNDIMIYLPDKALAQQLEAHHLAANSFKVAPSSDSNIHLRTRWGPASASQMHSSARAKLNKEDFPSLTSQAPSRPKAEGKTAFERFEAWKKSQPKSHTKAVVHIETPKSSKSKAKKKKKKKSKTTLLDAFD